jgi:hypothetical protein
MENFLFDAIARLTKAGVDMNEENLKKLVNVAKEMQWIPRVPEPIENFIDPLKRKQWIEEKQARVFTLNASDGLLQIDIFLTYPFGFEELNKDADVFEVEGIRFKVSSKHHLLKAKKRIENKRRQDLYDIDMLEELLHENREN